MASKNLSSDEEFVNALEENAAHFNIELRAEDVRGLRRYYRIVSDWNARLHLVAPCTPTEFATRHVLESLLALPHLPHSACVIDVGSGAGLPAIPCLIARPDLSAVLIEASPKKSVFLREALSEIERRENATVIAERFEKVAPPVADVLTCRAIERFTETLPELVEWSAKVETLVLFGGLNLEEALKRTGLKFEPVRVPESERRYLFVVKKTTRRED